MYEIIFIEIQICFFRSSWWFTGEKEANTIYFRGLLKKANLEYIIHYILYSSVNSILIFKTRSLSCVQILFTRCYMHIHFFASFSVAHSCSSSSSESSVQPLPPSLFFLLMTPFLPPTGRYMLYERSLIYWDVQDCRKHNWLPETRIISC